MYSSIGLDDKLVGAVVLSRAGVSRVKGNERVSIRERKSSSSISLPLPVSLLLDASPETSTQFRPKRRRIVEREGSCRWGSTNKAHVARKKRRVASARNDRPSTAALDATRIACNTSCLVVSYVSLRSSLRTPGQTNEIGGLTPSVLLSRPSLPSSPPASFLVCYPRRYLLVSRQRPVSPYSSCRQISLSLPTALGTTPQLADGYCPWAVVPREPTAPLPYPSSSSPPQTMANLCESQPAVA